MSNTKFSCIIPFYNEGPTLLEIIEVISKSKFVNQIIVVDDGSTNDLYKSLEGVKDIEFIRSRVNQGKARAVKIGVDKAKNEDILMMDADFHDLTLQELERILELFSSSNLDMLLLKVGGGNNWLDRVLRKEVLFTGFRVLKKSDLEKVFRSNPQGYQLEVAINEYMLLSKKKVAWMPTSVTNIHKSQKWGLVNGNIKSFQMELSILIYLGPINFSGLRARSFF